MRKSIAVSTLLSVGFTVILTLICCLGAHRILELMQIPADISGEAYDLSLIHIFGGGESLVRVQPGTPGGDGKKMSACRSIGKALTHFPQENAHSVQIGLRGGSAEAVLFRCGIAPVSYTHLFRRLVMRTLFAFRQELSIIMNLFKAAGILDFFRILYWRAAIIIRFLDWWRRRWGLL